MGSLVSWSAIEPEHDASFSGSPGQEGASMEWKGEIIGAGKMTLEPIVDDHYRHDLAFFRRGSLRLKR